MSSSGKGFHEHDDHQGVFVRLWTMDLVDGDLHAALLLNQLLWWHRPNLDGSPKLRHERNGHRWLLRPDDGWYDECRMTTKQVRRVRSVLITKGVIEHRRFKLQGAPTSAWRPLHDAIQAIRPKPELPSEGQFHGSDPGGAVPSDPQGAVPIPFSSRDLLIREPRDSLPFFDAFWTAYPRSEEKGQARIEWKSAIKKATPEVIIAAAERYAADPSREHKYTPYPAKWLKGERWEDDPSPPGSRNPSPRGTTDNTRTFANYEEFKAWKADQK